MNEVLFGVEPEKELGLAARRRGDREAALQHFRAATIANPNDLWAQQEFATELRELGRLDDAEAAFRDIVAKTPRFSHGWQGLGKVSRARGDREAALQHFRAAVEADPNHAWSQHDAATELRELGRLDDAEAAFRDIVTRNPRFSPGWFELGKIARRRGDREAALEHFRAAVEADPNHLWAHQEFATELRELGRLDEAEAAFRDIVAKLPASRKAGKGLERFRARAAIGRRRWSIFAQPSRPTQTMHGRDTTPPPNCASSAVWTTRKRPSAIS